MKINWEKGFCSCFSCHKISKKLLIMKLIVILLVLSLVEVHASVYSQSKKFTLDLHGKPIREVLKTIEQNSKFKFFYNEDFINVDKIVDISVEESRVEDVLDRVLVNTGIAYQVLDNDLIVLTQKTSNQSESEKGKVKIEGRITDSSTGEPVVGAVVMLKESKKAVVADVDGKFVLEVVDPQNESLVVSMVGYAKKEIPIGSFTNFDVRLEQEVTSMEEVVVIGYGVQKKKDLTGAVAVVNVDEMKKVRSTSIAESLQGQAGGILVTSSGEPGKMAEVKIRGISSLNNTQPLYVIDGVIVDNADNINPTDIESVQILKDASSAAIYGSRGMNGVIIITTKKGKEGPVKIDFSGSFSFDKMPKKLKVMDSREYLYYNELSYLNAGIEWPGRPAIGQYIPNTDWQDAIFQTGITQDYNLSLSGGNQNGNYLVGLGYLDQTGVIIEPWYKRYSLRVNSSGKRGIFSFGENLTIIRFDQRVTQGGSFSNALFMPPVIPVYDPNESSHRGGFGYGSVSFPTYASNPVAIQKSVKDERRNYRMVGNIYTEIQILESLKFKSNFSADFRDQTIKSIDYGYTKRYLTVETRWNDKLFTAFDQWLTLIQEQTLTFNKSFNKHNVELLGGWSAQDNRVYNAGNEGYNQQVKGLEQMDLIGTMNKMWGSEQHGIMESYFGRLNYNYDDKYFLQGNIRRDRSSKFYYYDKKRQIGVFSSFSVGYRISKEDFFEPLLKIVNDLKLRGGYGTIGDQSGIGYYDTRASIERSGPYEGYYAIFNGKVFQGAIQSKPVNTSLSWEKKTTLSIGADLAFFNNRLLATVDWYNAITEGILVDLPVAMVTGIGLSPSDARIWTNYGKLQNQGLELSLLWKESVNDLNYSIGFNFGTLKNKVLRLGDKYREGAYNQVNRTEEGRSVADFYLIKTDGLFKSWDEIYSYTTVVNGETKLIQPNAKPGDVKYIDYNNDGKIDLNDRQWCGSPLPKFTFGFNSGISYKGIDFSLFITGVYGNKIFNGLRNNLENMNSPDNITADGRPWTYNNQSTDIPRPVFGTSDNAKMQSDKWLEDGSYLRIRNLQIGYTFPSLKNKRIYEKIRLYVSGQNLYTFTKYKGYDPELAGNGIFELGCDWGQFPPVKSFIVGLQMSF